MAPMGANFEEVDGSVSEALIDYFEARARGGVGLILSPFTMVNREQRIGTLGIFSDRFIPGINRLCERVQSHGARFVLQIAHPGGKSMREFTERRPVAPSRIYSPLYPEVPGELTEAEIENLVEEFLQAARRARDAGCDGVEIHGAHTYLIGQFISPHANKRDDGWGGDFDRRMRFPSEIARGVKRICGDDFIIGFKFSAHEHLEGGIDDELAPRVARHMEKEGCHYIHVAATSSTLPGFLDCDFPSVPSLYSPQGALVALAENVKKAVDIPVIAAGGITDPGYAEKVLQEKKADLIALGRALIADPDWPVKAEKGQKMRYCIKCNTCHQRLFNKMYVKCTVNPQAGEEKRLELKRALSPKKVAVVGAGPAGMEAALAASERGHSVTLFDLKKRVGGNLVYGSLPEFKPEIGKLLEYYEDRIKKSSIDVKLGKKISNLDQLLKEKPDVIVIAVGAEPFIPDIPGKE